MLVLGASVCQSVAHGIREAVDDDPSLGDVTVVVPLPRAEDIEFGERVKREERVTPSVLGATFVDAPQEVLPRHELGLTRR